jgi:hypothetical protein
MKYEKILEGLELPPRDTRVDVDYDVRVHCETEQFEAQILNLSADGFRLHSSKPMAVGAEVTLEVPKQYPVRALICWACGLEAGGVFSDPVVL